MIRIRNKVSCCIVIILAVLLLVGCGKREKPKPIEGKYISVDGNSYILLENYKNGNAQSEKNKLMTESSDMIGTCELQFHNIDLSIIKNNIITMATTSYFQKHHLSKASQEEKDNVKNMLESNIDLDKQFAQNKAKVNYIYSTSEKNME